MHCTSSHWQKICEIWMNTAAIIVIFPSCSTNSFSVFWIHQYYSAEVHVVHVVTIAYNFQHPETLKSSVDWGFTRPTLQQVCVSTQTVIF